MPAEALLPRRTCLAAVLALALGGAKAQTAQTAQTAPPAQPATSDMIEALKPGRTRGARNLIVRQKPADSVAPTPEYAVAGAAAGAPAEPAPATESEAPPSLSLPIQFELNSSRVRPESGPLLGDLVAALQAPELKGSRFLIEGHTDASGNPGTNQRLSQERAEEVRLYLVALGVHPARLRAVGRGSSDPADPLNPQAAHNRRVRVVTQP